MEKLAGRRGSDGGDAEWLQERNAANAVAWTERRLVNMSGRISQHYNMLSDRPFMINTEVV